MSNEVQRQNINIAKSYIDTFVTQSRYAKTAEYIESKDDEGIIILKQF